MPDSTLTAAYAELIRATMAVAGPLLDEIPDSVRPAVDAALQGGARLVVETELPDCSVLTVWLVEREGRRHRLHGVGVSRGLTQ